jgi:putative Holliday junction resolvase
MGRILALDVGDARIGLAISDMMKIIANPLETYKRKKDNTDYEYIAKIAKENDVELIICGLPLSMDSTENAQTQKTRDFIENLVQFTHLPIRFIDERLTTVSAERTLIESGMRREKRKDVIDKVAATIILQNFLDYYTK